MKMKVIFIQYWILATTGFSEMKLHPLVQGSPATQGRAETYVKILRLTLKGSGMIRSINSAISNTSNKKT